MGAILFTQTMVHYLTPQTVQIENASPSPTGINSQIGQTS